MRFLILNANLCRTPYPVYPLGMSVAAAAVKAAGHTVKQFDTLPQGMECSPALIREYKPDMLGISIRNLDTVNSRTPEDMLKTPLELIRIVRENTSAPIVLGGAGFSLLPERIMELTGAEYGIVGEGEEALIELLNGEKHPNGLIRKSTSKQYSPLFDPEILNFYYRETHIIPIQTKRGCPFECAYCTYPNLEGKKLRERDANAVLNQLEELLAQYPDAMFYFVDAVFNDPHRVFEHFLNTMRQRETRIPFAAFLSPFALKEADVILMRECGMIAAELGIDAASDETLAGLQKGFTFAEAGGAAELLQKHGIGVTTNVMFGGPGETWETVEKGIANLRSIEPAYTMIFSGIRVYPQTPLYETAQKEDKIPQNWDPMKELYYFANGINPETLHEKLSAGFDGSKFCIYPPDAKNGELQTLHKFGYAKWRKMQ